MKTALGLPKNKIKGLLFELQRKGFHTSGLLVPLLYYFLMNVWLWGSPVMTKPRAIALCSTVGLAGITFELTSKFIPAARQLMLKYASNIMRKDELKNKVILTGGSMFFLFLHLRIPLLPCFILAISGALAASFAELFAIFDDNLSMPIISGFILSCTAYALDIRIPLPNETYIVP
ncbi:hypothetical protein Pelo_16699 [Pelomyxa schiedti]|nr:hypothetical protein Pelo_16699 [Pelomyxa schiedti]